MILVKRALESTSFPVSLYINESAWHHNIFPLGAKHKPKELKHVSSFYTYCDWSLIRRLVTIITTDHYHSVQQWCP